MVNHEIHCGEFNHLNHDKEDNFVETIVLNQDPNLTFRIKNGRL